MMKYITIILISLLSFIFYFNSCKLTPYKEKAYEVNCSKSTDTPTETLTSNDKIYLSVYGNDAFHSENQGKSWGKSSIKPIWANSASFDGYSRVVAVGSTNGFAYSNDGGKNWKKVVQGKYFDHQLRSVIYDEHHKNWIAVGIAGDVVRSKTGLNWCKGNIGVKSNLNSLASDKKGTIMAVGTSVATTSKDGGKTWSTVNIIPRYPFSEKELNQLPFFKSVVYDGKKRWVAIGNRYLSENKGETEKYIVYSDNDGNTWSSNKFLGEIILTDIATDKKGNWIAVGSYGGKGYYLYSDSNAASWSKIQEIPGSYDINYIEYDQAGYWLAGGGGKIFSSVDGKSWKSVTTDTVPVNKELLVLNPNPNDEDRPNYNDRVVIKEWVVLGENLTGLTVDDGNNWKVLESGADFRSALSVDGKGHWVTVGTNGVISYSKNNGESWDTSDIDVSMSAVANDGNGHWVAVGEFFTASSNNAGESWQLNDLRKKHPSLKHTLQCIATDRKGKWIAASKDIVLTSLDNGASWTRSEVSENFDIKGVATDDAGTWVLVGAGPDVQLAYSRDNGKTWKLQKGLASLSAIATDGKGIWIAVGENGLIVKFINDFSTPEKYTIPSEEQLNDIQTNKNGKWFAVGNNGTIASSLDNGEKWLLKSFAKKTNLLKLSAPENDCSD